MATIRLTQYAHGGGCACKIPPGELEQMVRGLAGSTPLGETFGELLVGLDTGDDAAVVRIQDDLALVVTTVRIFSRPDAMGRSDLRG